MSDATRVHDQETALVEVSSLHTYHRNPRHGDIEAITRSLIINGQYRPIVVNKGTHTGRALEVLAGNHTLMAARNAGWQNVSACYVDVDDDAAMRIVAADNRTADLGSYDDDQLAELLKDIGDLDGTGYSDDDLALLLNPARDVAAPEHTPHVITEGSCEILHGSALDLPVEDDSIDLVVTSPPYFGLRSYQDDGDHYDGQIGSEPTPPEFIDALLAATREMLRVLKPTGSIWVNLGDKYATAGTRQGNAEGLANYGDDRTEQARHYGKRPEGFQDKSLIGLPWRYALACVDQLGLILRAEVIWEKPNGLPESVSDRVRRNHEHWFHFTTQEDYYANVNDVREAYKAQGTESDHDRRARTEKFHELRSSAENQVGRGLIGTPLKTLGRIPGSVWTVAIDPLHVPDHLGIDHHAAFPMELPRRIVQGWSPPGYCTQCGEARKTLIYKGSSDVDHDGEDDQENEDDQTPVDQVGYMCGCDAATAPTLPARVLDPFGGTGTTALVSKAWGRHGVHVDLSKDYCRLAEWRTNDPAQIAKAMQVSANDLEFDLEGDDDHG